MGEYDSTKTVSTAPRRLRSFTEFFALLFGAAAVFAIGIGTFIVSDESCGAVRFHAVTIIIGIALLFAVLTAGLRRLLLALGRSAARARKVEVAMRVVLAFPTGLCVLAGVLTYAFGAEGC